MIVRILTMKPSKKKFASIKPEKTGDIIWSYIFLLFKTRLT